MAEPVAEKRCRNGHLIDVSWDLCPYCPPEAADISIVRPRGADESHNRAWAASPALPPTEVPVPEPPPVRRTSPQTEAPPVSRTIAVPKADLGIGPAPAPRIVVGWLVGLTGVIRGESFTIRIGKNDDRTRSPLRHRPVRRPDVQPSRGPRVPPRGKALHPDGRELHEWNVRERCRDRASKDARAPRRHRRRKAEVSLHPARRRLG